MTSIPIAVFRQGAEDPAGSCDVNDHAPMTIGGVIRGGGDPADIYWMRYMADEALVGHPLYGWAGEPSKLVRTSTSSEPATSAIANRIAVQVLVTRNRN